MVTKKKLYGEIQEKMNMISFIPDSIISVYIGANKSRKRARTGWLYFSFLAV